MAKQTVNKCKCDYIYCDAHRYPDRHECTFDHAKMDKGKTKKKNRGGIETKLSHTLSANSQSAKDILAKNNPKLNERPKGGRSFQRIDSL